MWLCQKVSGMDRFASAHSGLVPPIFLQVALSEDTARQQAVWRGVFVEMLQS